MANGTEAIVERLLAHRLLGDVPRPQLEWLAERGVLRRYETGEALFAPGQEIHALAVVFSGRFDIRVNRSGTWRRVLEWGAGDLAGILPFSRMKASPGEARIQEAIEVLELSDEHFPELVRECHDITARCVHVMLDRARQFRSSDLHDEKLTSLGRLAAGLAHELNNPVSAVARNAATLVERLPATEAAFRALGEAGLDEAGKRVFADLRERCLRGTESAARSPLDEAERVEELGDWLERYDVDRAEAEALAETAMTRAELERAASSLPAEALVPLLRAIAAGCGTRRLAVDIEGASRRVHELVAAIKGFTYMDQATVPTSVDIGRGLADTVAVLRSKARAKSIRVVSEAASDLPCVTGFGGELNQVWLNLLDNAIDASPAHGTVTVSAAREGDRVAVAVTDEGPGISAEVRDRIFEPFFTTKPVGKGTGLGLSISRTLVSQHDGDLEVESKPGRTTFRVLLPVAPRKPPAG